MTKLYRNENANNIYAEIFSAESNDKELKLKAVNPNTTDAAQEKHVPVISVQGNEVTVVIGSVLHPMLEEHYITGIYIETRQGGQFKHLSPGEEPKAVFVLSDGDELVAAYEHCNLHGVWQAER